MTLRWILPCLLACLVLSVTSVGASEMSDHDGLSVRVEILEVGPEDAEFVDGDLLWGVDYMLRSGESFDLAYRDKDSDRIYSVTIEISVPEGAEPPQQEVVLESIWTAGDGQPNEVRFLIDGEFGATLFRDRETGRHVYLRVVPRIRWISAEPADLPHYEILGELDPKAREIRARATVSFPPDHAMLAAGALLDLGRGGNPAREPRLRVDALQIGEQQWAPRELDRREGALVLPEVWRKVRTVSVEYTVALDDGVRDTLGYDAFFSTGPGTAWYPGIVAARGGTPRFWNFDVQLTAPAQVKLLCTGREIERRGVDTAAPSRIFRASHVEGFSLNAAQDMELVEVLRDDIKVVALVPPDRRESFLRAAELTAGAAVWYRNRYGFLPAAQIGILPGHPTYSGGFPASGLYYLHLGTLTPDFLAEITAHELGHYFWGQHVLSGTERELDWLMLGLGIWADQLYLAERYSRSLADQWRGNEWLRRFVSTQQAGLDQRLGISAREEAVLDFDYNTLVRHAKGAIGIWLLSQRMGVESFLELQRELLEDYAFRPLTPEELGHRLEARGVTNAGAFLRRWAEGDAELGYEIRSVDRVGGESSFCYDVHVIRTGTIDWPVSVSVRSRDGRLLSATTSGTDFSEVLRFFLEAPLESAVIDADGVLPLSNSGHADMRRLFREARS